MSVAGRYACDELTISGRLLKKNTPAERKKARELITHAIDLRTEGMDELEALRPVANETFFRKIAEGEVYNLKTLEELETLIERGAPRAEMLRYNKRVQRDYTYLRNLQRNGWAKYEKSLTARRDALLKTKYGQSASKVITTRPYEAGEFLGESLDARFSPTHMAKFLAAHLETKQQQARALGIADENLDAWTAALYNGGAVNIKRMRAGLIGSLTATMTVDQRPQGSQMRSCAARMPSSGSSGLRREGTRRRPKVATAAGRNQKPMRIRRARRRSITGVPRGGRLVPRAAYGRRGAWCHRAGSALGHRRTRVAVP